MTDKPLHEHGGLCHVFDVQADTRSQLVSCLSILMKWHKHIKQYRIMGEPKEQYLELLWGGPDGVPFMTPMTDPEWVVDQVEAWLSLAHYGKPPDTDGSVYKGWRVRQSPIAEPGTYPLYEPYRVCVIYPAWNIYGK